MIIDSMNILFLHSKNSFFKKLCTITIVIGIVLVSLQVINYVY